MLLKLMPSNKHASRLACLFKRGAGGGAIFDTLPHMLEIKISVRVRYERAVRPTIFAITNIGSEVRELPNKKKNPPMVSHFSW